MFAADSLIDSRVEWCENYCHWGSPVANNTNAVGCKKRPRARFPPDRSKRYPLCEWKNRVFYWVPKRTGIFDAKQQINNFLRVWHIICALEGRDQRWKSSTFYVCSTGFVENCSKHLHLCDQCCAQFDHAGVQNSLLVDLWMDHGVIKFSYNGRTYKRFLRLNRLLPKVLQHFDFRFVHFRELLRRHRWVLLESVVWVDAREQGIVRLSKFL